MLGVTIWPNLLCNRSFVSRLLQQRKKDVSRRKLRRQQHSTNAIIQNFRYAMNPIVTMPPIGRCRPIGAFPPNRGVASNVNFVKLGTATK